MGRFPYKRGMRLSLALFLCLTLHASAADLFPVGEIIPEVISRVDPEESYALYLPSSFEPHRSYPILYCFDARRRATLPLERFRDAADRFGFILASAHSACSDGPVEPNLKAMDAMWSDTHRRFNLEPGRAYATGLSGGARVASLMGLIFPEEVAGVIGVCAGLSTRFNPREPLPFAFFGLTGEEDYNYGELHRLQEYLQAAGTPHRLQVFEGGHEWAPPASLEDALAWMVLQADLEEGRTSEDELAFSWQRDLDRADRLEKQGSLLQLGTHLKSMARDYRQTGAAWQELQLRLQGLVESAEYRRRDRLHEKILSRETAYFKRLERLVSRIHYSERRDELLLPGAVLFDLKVTALKRKAKSNDEPLEKLSALRRLNTAFVEMGFYQARTYMNEGDNRRAQLCLFVASEIKPENPFVWYNLARTQAREGQDQDALDSLEMAVSKGFKYADHLAGNEDFAPLRRDLRFQGLLARIVGRES